MSVVGLRDRKVVNNPAEPDLKVVEALEYLLGLAKSGQITGLAYATHYFDGVGAGHYVGRVSRNTVGQIFAVATRISQAIDNEP